MSAPALPRPQRGCPIRRPPQAVGADHLGIHEGGALLLAKLHLDNPVENLLVQSIRVVDVAPRSNEKCKWMVTLRAYSLFWFYRTLIVRCGNVSG